MIFLQLKGTYQTLVTWVPVRGGKRRPITWHVRVTMGGVSECVTFKWPTASAVHDSPRAHQITFRPKLPLLPGGGAKMTFTAASPTKENSLDTWKGGWTAMWESSIDVTESLTCYELSVLVQCFEMWNLVLDQTFKSHESELRTAGTRHYVGWSWDESVWGK